MIPAELCGILLLVTLVLALLLVSHFVLSRRFLRWLDNPEQAIPKILPRNLRNRAKTIQQKHHDLALVNRVYDSLFAVDNAVLLLDAEGKLLWWNISAKHLLRLDDKQKNTHILSLVDDDNFVDYFNATKNEYLHDSHNNEGVRLISPLDSNRYLQCKITNVGADTLLTLYDVTRLHHLEQMRKDFVANVSHELRTPLTVLMGYIETFADSDDVNPKWQRGFSLMAQQTKRMDNIVNDLLMLSRLENEERFVTSCVDMPKLLTSLFDDAQVYNKGYNHLIDLHIDSQSSIIGSEKYLTSALLNLVTNAIKYTPQNGEIQLAWQAVQDGCVFSVTDNGLGIAPEHIDRLTERFYRVDSGRSRQTGGTGLGLAIVKHVLYQHGARLQIDSTEGKGSTFTIHFPKSLVCVGK